MSAALANEDRLPHDRAVWRDYRAELLPYDGAPVPGTGGHQVSIDYGGSQMVLTWGHTANWHGAKRWRFGWPPA
jgi:hypothetical protein